MSYVLFFLRIPGRVAYCFIYWVGCFIVRPLLIRCDNGSAKISPTASIKFPRNIKLGANVFINHNCCVWADSKSSIVIGDDVLLGPGVIILTSNHGTKYGALIRSQAEISSDVVIGSDVWIGANSVILPGVNIGSGTVVGAGSVVTRDLPENSICFGTPAMPYRARV